MPLGRDGGSKLHEEKGNGFKKHKDKMNDEYKNKLDEKAADALASKAVTWPSKLYAYVKFGYDNTMKAQLAKDGISFGDWIDKVMTHVQAYYNHQSLPTKIMFKVLKCGQKL